VVATVKFTLRFHTPFRVATGTASDGLNEVHDPVNPIPASSVKGLMRANAKLILRVDKAVRDEVFGSRRIRCPWWWSDVMLDSSASSIRTRLGIDPETGTAAEGALFTASELWADSGWFEVLDRDRIDPQRRDLHIAVLKASALAITSFGADRRRGLGWVGITPESPWDDTQHRLLLAHRRHDA
jgi:CRISPR/Cas system CSM-associated protein Csm3 (group 7 of RAMP superfamily)